MKLTVFFDGQFWVGLLEKEENKKYYSTLHTFGEEPKEGEIYHFVSFELSKLTDRQTRHVETDAKALKKMNPKRMKRLASKEMSANPMSTKSQEAIQQQLEANKTEKKRQTREMKEAEKEYKRQLAREKKKQKHKGH